LKKGNVDFVETGTQAISNLNQAISPVTSAFSWASQGALTVAKFGLGAAITAVYNREKFVERVEEIADSARKKVAEGVEAGKKTVQQGIASDRAARSELAEATKLWAKNQLQYLKEDVQFHADEIRASFIS
jgi:hypothetical protein